MNVTRKILHFISTIFFYSIILVLAICFLMVVTTVIDKKISSKNGKTQSPLFGAYVILTNSMVPSINVADAVVTIRVNEDKIHINDIITFLSKEIHTGGTPVTHRVIGIVYENNSKDKIIGYRTKGDHNNTEDFALISPQEVIGKVLFKIPMVGYLQIFMTKPIGWLFLIVLPCLFIIGSDIRKLLRLSNKDKKVSQEVISTSISQQKIENSPEIFLGEEQSNTPLESTSVVSTFPIDESQTNNIDDDII